MWSERKWKWAFESNVQKGCPTANNSQRNLELSVVLDIVPKRDALWLIHLHHPFALLWASASWWLKKEWATHDFVGNINSASFLSKRTIFFHFWLLKIDKKNSKNYGQTMDKLGLKKGILLTKIAFVCCNVFTRFQPKKEFLGWDSLKFTWYYNAYWRLVIRLLSFSKN